jgi:hypothetical protein
MSAFVYILAKNEWLCLLFVYIKQKEREKISSSKAFVSFNIYSFCLKPKGYNKTELYLKVCRGTILYSTQNAKYQRFEITP